jgi:hypothetical protein
MIKKRETLLTIGMWSYLIFTLLKWTVGGTGFGDFFQGFFVGLSIVFTLAYAACRRRMGMD